jgi:hypothetical protein
VRVLVARLGTVRAQELLEKDGLGTQILGRGEAAIPPLLEAVASPDPRMRAPAAYLLGVLKDRRTLPTLATLAESDPAASVRYEAAAALLLMLDARGFAPLVAGLSDPDARLRHTCIDVLAEATHERWGYEADGPPDEREAAIRRWNAWLEQRAAVPSSTGGAKPLLWQDVRSVSRGVQAKVGFCAASVLLLRLVAFSNRFTSAGHCGSKWSDARSSSSPRCSRSSTGTRPPHRGPRMPRPPGRAGVGARQVV